MREVSGAQLYKAQAGFTLLLSFINGTTRSEAVGWPEVTQEEKTICRKQFRYTAKEITLGLAENGRVLQRQAKLFSSFSPMEQRRRGSWQGKSWDLFQLNKHRVRPSTNVDLTEITKRTALLFLPPGDFNGLSPAVDIHCVTNVLNRTSRGSPRLMGGFQVLQRLAPFPRPCPSGSWSQTAIPSFLSLSLQLLPLLFKMQYLLIN